jgi:hypothetical protein
MCKAQAQVEEFTIGWFHFKCATCVEFIATTLAVKLLSESQAGWGSASSLKAKKAPEGKIFRISRPPAGSSGSAALVGEYVERKGALHLSS